MDEYTRLRDLTDVPVKVPVPEREGQDRIGRFGWKDQHASLLAFAADAYLNEMGITSSLQKTEVTTICNPPVTTKIPNNDPTKMPVRDDSDSLASNDWRVPSGPITAVVVIVFIALPLSFVPQLHHSTRAGSPLLLRVLRRHLVRRRP